MRRFLAKVESRSPQSPTDSLEKSLREMKAAMDDLQAKHDELEGYDANVTKWLENREEGIAKLRELNLEDEISRLKQELGL